MKSLTYICGNCGTEKDISDTADLMFEICPSCQTMGEWSQPEGAESEGDGESESEEPESTVENETEPATDLILIEENQSLADIWIPKNVDAMIDKLEQYKNEFKGNVKTAKGRKAIISFSRKFSSSKVLVDNMGKELVEDWQTQTKTVNTQRRKFKDACDQFRDESRKPVTDYENAEKLVIANQNTTLARLVDLYNVAGDLDVATYEAYIAEVNAIEIDGDVDFIERGSREKEQTLDSLGKKLAAKIQYNKDQADLAKLREDDEKRQAEETKKKEVEERKESDKKIKLQAKKEADEKAAKKIADAKEAEATAKDNAKKAAEKAELDKKEAAEKAEYEKEEAIKDEQRKTKEAAEQAEVDKKEWILREKEKAANRESARVAKEEEEKKEAEEKAADQDHRAKIKEEACCFVAGAFGLPMDQVEDIFDSISGGEVPHITVNY
jgi:hypothetical protein